MIAEVNKEERVKEVESLEEKVTDLVSNGKYRLAIDELVLLLQIKEGVAICEQPESRKLRKRITGEVDQS